MDIDKSEGLSGQILLLGRKTECKGLLQNMTIFLIGADHVAKHIFQYIVGKLLTQGI